MQRTAQSELAPRWSYLAAQKKVKGHAADGATETTWDAVAMVTMVQLEEYLVGWTTLSWYNILHTVTTQVHTVHTPDSRGRHLRQGRDTATHSTNTRFNRHTCRHTDRSPWRRGDGETGTEEQSLTSFTHTQMM